MPSRQSSLSHLTALLVPLAIASCHDLSAVRPNQTPPPSATPSGYAIAPAPPSAPAPAKPRDFRDCEAVNDALAAALKPGSSSDAVRQTLARANFVYREQAVMDAHHVELPRLPDQHAFQFGCVPGHEHKLDLSLNAAQGAQPTLRFFVRTAGATKGTFKAFLESPNASIVEVATAPIKLNAQGQPVLDPVAAFG